MAEQGTGDGYGDAIARRAQETLDEMGATIRRMGESQATGSLVSTPHALALTGDEPKGTTAQYRLDPTALELRVSAAGCRSQLEALFDKYGPELFAAERLNHHPFVVLAVIPAERGVEVQVQIVKSAAELVRSGFADATTVLIQWPGQYRSDYFRATVGDVRRARTEFLTRATR